MSQASATIRIGTLSTVPIQDHDSPEREIGQFTMPIDLGREMFLRQGDKPGYVKTMIAHTLAHAIESTGVPADYWQCEIIETVARDFNIPEAFSLKVK